MKNIIFKNRTDVGQQLASKLLVYKSERPIVLALPRGGVLVGYEVLPRRLVRCSIPLLLER